jgi:Tol biopolymer transport system component
MDERELRERLNETGGAFHFEYESVDRVVRRARSRTLRMQALAAAVVVGSVVIVMSVLAGEEGRLSPHPQQPVGPGPTETAPDARDVNYVIDLDTGETTPLPRSIIEAIGEAGSREGDHYALSPDGSRLVFVGTGEEGSPQIFVAGIDGSRVRQITHDPTLATSPAWSPDGETIAYEGYGDGDVRNLFVVELATGESTQVTDVRRHAYGTQFTPDGSSLLYDSGSNQFPWARTVRIADGATKLLIGRDEGLSHTMNPSLSPDGSQVTFMGGPLGGPGPRRYVANADGSGRREINAECYGSNPAGTWSPDGTRIVCESDTGLVVVVDIATGDSVHVAEGTGGIWLDQNTLLVEICPLNPASCDRGYPSP